MAATVGLLTISFAAMADTTNLNDAVAGRDEEEPVVSNS